MSNNIENLFRKTAIVMDQMTAFGGADREMLSLLKLFPKADIYTILFIKEKYPPIKNKIHTSFLQKWTKILPKNFYRHLKIFTPYIYENFNLTDYDLIISISAGPGKSIITKPNQIHINRITTPPRNLWDNELNIRASKLKNTYKTISQKLNTKMRIWDWTTAQRVDYFVANSNYIAKKTERTYGRTAKVIYPGIEQKYYKTIPKIQLEQTRKKYKLPKNFILVISRLYDYKRVDKAIKASIKTNKNLVIVGEGPDKKYLEKLSRGHSNIYFLGFIPDNDTIALYQLAELFLFCGVEDFGLTPVEAMASGTPVFAYKEGGTLETIKDGVTGQFFQTDKELYNLLINYKEKSYNKEEIKKHAKNFSEEKFLNNFEKYILKVHDQQNKEQS